MTKRNVMISGEFTLSDMQQVSNTSNAAVTPTKKALERIEALKKAGIDTSSYYAINNDMVIRVEDGKPNLVGDDDPVWKAIKESGVVPDRRLFRRWVLSQMFHMLSSDFTKRMKWKGYEYTWRMTEEELRVQAKLYGHDNENYTLRNRFFNHDVVVDMATDYYSDLQCYIDNLKTRKCKGVPYKRIYGKDIFETDLFRKVYTPVLRGMRNIKSAKTPKELYKAVHKFNADRIPMHGDMKQSPAWVDAYKGAGAYFSMQNLIRFHGMKLRKSGIIFCKGEKAIDLLNDLASQKKGWELLGILKEALRYNNIDINKKMEEWSK